MTDKEAREVLHRYQVKYWSTFRNLKWEITHHDRMEERQWHYSHPSYVDTRLATLTDAGQHLLEVLPLANRIGRKKIKKIIAMLKGISEKS